MKSPLSYIDVSGIIESIVYTEGRKYTCPGISFEDIGQEIRLACIKALNSYNPARIGPSSFKFLQTCARNHVYNMNRGVIVPNNPPCVRCPLWDRYTKKCEEKEDGCEKIKQYRQHMAAKANLRAPNITINEEVTNQTDRYGSVEHFILDDSIRELLPGHLLLDYVRMLNGASDQVSTHHKNQIRRIVKGLIQDV